MRILSTLKVIKKVWKKEKYNMFNICFRYIDETNN